MKNKDLISSLQQDAQTTPEPKVINIILKIIHFFILYRKKERKLIGQTLMMKKKRWKIKKT